MIKAKRTIGKGITRREVEVETFDQTDGDQWAEVLRKASAFAASPFDSAFASAVDDIADQLARLRQSLPADHQFKESDWGWHAEQIVMRYRRAKRAAADGKIEQAMMHAGKLGMLIARQVAFDDHAVRGEAMARHASTGGSTRARPYSDRDVRIRRAYADLIDGKVDSETAKGMIEDDFEISRWTLNKALRK